MPNEPKPICLTLPSTTGDFSLESLRGFPVLFLLQSIQSAKENQWFIASARQWVAKNPERASHLRLVVAVDLSSVPEAFHGAARASAALMVSPQHTSALLFDSDGRSREAFGIPTMTSAPIAALLDVNGVPVWGKFGPIPMDALQGLEQKLVQLTEPLLSK